MGDTALIRGIAAAARQIAPQVKIIGVQAERAPSYYLSWKEGKVVGTETCDTIADGLATRTPMTPRRFRESARCPPSVQRSRSPREAAQGFRSRWSRVRRGY